MARTRTAQPIGREENTRQAEERFTDYRPPSNLPDPAPQDGYVFRWIRTAMFGDADNRNVSMRLREGWEPVRMEDHRELLLDSDLDTRFDGHVVVGGLMLCKCSEERIKQREEYYNSQAVKQRQSVDNNFMREEDQRMPLFQERDSKTSFGAGRRG